MASINPLDGLAEILRRRVASEATAKGRKLGNTKSTAGGAPVQRPPVEALKRRLGEAVDTIDPTDPDRPRKVVRLFVEGVLAWQFGDALLTDPGFAELAKEVQTTLEREPAFVAQLLAAISSSPDSSAR